MKAQFRLNAEVHELRTLHPEDLCNAIKEALDINNLTVQESHKLRSFAQMIDPEGLYIQVNEPVIKGDFEMGELFDLSERDR